MNVFRRGRAVWISYKEEEGKRNTTRSNPNWTQDLDFSQMSCDSIHTYQTSQMKSYSRHRADSLILRISYGIWIWTDRTAVYSIELHKFSITLKIYYIVKGRWGREWWRGVCVAGQFSKHSLSLYYIPSHSPRFNSHSLTALLHFIT